MYYIQAWSALEINSFIHISDFSAITPLPPSLKIALIIGLKIILGLLELSSMPRFGSESDVKEDSGTCDLQDDLPDWLQGILLSATIHISHSSKQAFNYFFNFEIINA